MRHAFVLFVVLAAVSCKSPSSDPAQRVRRNVEDRQAIEAEGVKLRQQGLCTPEAIAGARDPDRQYLACLGFATADGADPGILAFRQRHAGDDKATFTACFDPAAKPTHAVQIVLCQPAVERLRKVASQERQGLVSAGRCTNQALRAAGDPDGDYFMCYGHQLYFPEYIRLAEFKKRFGPGLDTIKGRCPEIGRRISNAEKKHHLVWGSQAGKQAPEPAGSESDDVLSFADAYNVFCTDETPRGAL
jgi:hypothetical protein